MLHLLWDDDHENIKLNIRVWFEYGYDNVYQGKMCSNLIV